MAEALTLEALAETYQQAKGCTQDKAAEVLAAVFTYWDIPSAATVAKLVAQFTAVGELDPADVVVALNVFRHMERVQGAPGWLLAASLRAQCRQELRGRAH